MKITLDTFVFDCKNPHKLALFYARLLGWDVTYTEHGEWVDISNPLGGVKLAFQCNPDYIAPVFPDAAGKQQQMAHLDFTVQNKQELDIAVQHAVACGAKICDVQYDVEKWITMLDPEGHPFCFVIEAH